MQFCQYQVQVDFDDKTRWEYLFKVYWVLLKEKLALTLDELTNSTNPLKELREASANIEPKHQNDVAYLINSYKSLYLKWVFDLSWRSMGFLQSPRPMNQNSKNYVSGIVKRRNLSEFDMSKLGVVNFYGRKGILPSQQRKRQTLSLWLKASVQDLASRAASRAMAEAAKSISLQIQHINLRFPVEPYLVSVRYRLIF
ncbi:hypothetical protein GOBAR_DD22928 [Gossypium barbadense]|nr:hypothetical protein GOBAR_DD22928 [Gossypium barbadense]